MLFYTDGNVTFGHKVFTTNLTHFLLKALYGGLKITWNTNVFTIYVNLCHTKIDNISDYLLVIISFLDHGINEPKEIKMIRLNKK